MVGPWWSLFIGALGGASALSVVSYLRYRQRKKIDREVEQINVGYVHCQGCHRNVLKLDATMDPDTRLWWCQPCQRPDRPSRPPPPQRPITTSHTAMPPVQEEEPETEIVHCELCGGQQLISLIDGEFLVRCSCKGWQMRSVECPECGGRFGAVTTSPDDEPPLCRHCIKKRRVRMIRE